MKKVFFIACAAAAFTASTVSAAPPRQFKTIEEMVEFTNDYYVGDGTFKVIKRKPLHIQLKIDHESESQYAAEAMFRAFLWGTFRTFLHTKAEEVTITVVSPTPVNGRTRMTNTVTREHTLDVVKRIPGIRGWNDILTEDQTWADPMNRCFYSSYGRPGLRDCAMEIAGYRTR